MQTMSTAMATLLKSGKMIGSNKPTAEVVIKSATGDSIDIISEDLTLRHYGDDAAGLSQWVSNYVVGADGEEFCAIHHSTTGEIYIGRMDNNEDYFYMDYPITNAVATGISFDNDEYVKGKMHISLYRRDDGKILMFFGWPGTSTTVGQLDCYISNNGMGTDFQHYSTVHLQSTPQDYNFATFTVGVAMKDLNGNLWLTAHIGDISGGAIRGGTSIFKSMDNGLNWLSKKILRDGTGHDYIGGITELPNGDLITSYVTSDSYTNYLYSVDGGENWIVSTDKRITYSNLYPDNETQYFMHDDLYCDGNLLIAFSPSADGGTGILSAFHVAYMNNPTIEKIIGLVSWEGLIQTSYTNTRRSFVTKSPSGYFFLGMFNAASDVWGVERVEGDITLQPKSITINRSKGMAGGLTLEFDNKSAILAPDGTANPQLLWPNKEVVVKQGYGAELLKTFTGLIDSISMSRDEQGVASVTVSVRDKLKVALDHLIRNQDFLYTLTYTNMLVEDIWKNLVGLAGLAYNTVESTGLTISEKTFSWETYADAFSWLDEIAGSETYCDEDGLLNFVWDGRPATVTTAYSFVEGVDITRLGYEINDVDLFYTVAVYGKSPEVLDVDGKVVTESSVIYFAKQLPQATYWNIPSGKVLRIDAPDADTQAKCEIIADKAIYLMQTRARQVTFSTIGIPHLQRGDFIQVEESSTTISEIYRITDITTQQGPDGYGMTLTCYYHAAPEVV